MTPLIFITILALILINFSWAAHRKIVTARYRYSFFALRDKLRTYTIEGKIKSHDWTFSYLDSSLSKTVNRLSLLNLWNVLLLYFFHKKSMQMSDLDRHMKIAFEKNKYVKEIYNEYGALSIGYVFEKHFLVYYLTIWGLKSWILYFTVMQNIMRYLKEKIL